MSQIFSMTGYASGTHELPAGSLSLELRAVNHRYLDVQFRQPDEFRPIEPKLREAITAQLTRGKVECRIAFTPHTADKASTQLNLELLRQLGLWNKTVLAEVPEASSMTAGEILRWNGVLESAALPADALQEAATGLLKRVLADFTAARAREGARLKDFLLQRMGQITQLGNEVAPRIPATITAYQEKLSARLREVLQTSDNERLHQEITLFASKIDVDEELSRLKTHLSEMQRVLDKGGVIGKRLDFLMQELHREANTLGSKSVDAEVSRTSMEMKILIEQMREQIQNIE